MGLLLILKLRHHVARPLQFPALRAHALGRIVEFGLYGVQFLGVLLLDGRQAIRNLIPQLPGQVVPQLVLLRVSWSRTRVHPADREHLPHGQGRENQKDDHKLDTASRTVGRLRSESPYAWAFHRLPC